MASSGKLSALELLDMFAQQCACVKRGAFVSTPQDFPSHKQGALTRGPLKQSIDLAVAERVIRIVVARWHSSQPWHFDNVLHGQRLGLRGHGLFGLASGR